MTTLVTALTALKRGKQGVRLPMEWTGLAGKVADAFNDVVELNERMADELARLRRVAGKEGKLAERMSLGDVSGFWDESVKSVNAMIDDLVHGFGSRRRVAQGRIPEDGPHDQQDGRSTELVRQRSHPRGP
jgi:hypothetical protein